MSAAGTKSQSAGSQSQVEKVSRLRGLGQSLPAIAVIGVLAIGLVGLGIRSFHEYDSYTGDQGDLSLSQFGKLLVDENAGYYLEIIGRTLFVSIVVMVCSVLLALPVAYFIVRTSNNTLRALALGLTLVPFLMGDVVRAFGWLLLLGSKGAYGWATSIVGEGGTLVGSLLGITLGILHTMIPLSVFVLLPAVRRIEPDLERAAASLGAKPYVVWLRVVFPLLRPGLIAAGIVAFALATTQYAIPDMLGGGRLPFAANAIQTAFFAQGNINLGAALAMLMLVVVFCIVGIASSFSKTKVRHPDHAFSPQQGGKP